MSKQKVALAILFILAVSLLNGAVFISASNHESQLSVDAVDQQVMPAAKKKYVDNACGTYNKRCTVNAPGGTCWEIDGKC